VANEAFEFLGDDAAHVYHEIPLNLRYLLTLDDFGAAVELLKLPCAFLFFDLHSLTVFVQVCCLCHCVAVKLVVNALECAGVEGVSASLSLKCLISGLTAPAKMLIEGHQGCCARRVHKQTCLALLGIGLHRRRIWRWWHLPRKRHGSHGSK